MSVMTPKELNDLFTSTFPDKLENIPDVTLAEDGYVEMELKVSEKHLRPGGYISGPTQMGLADHAAYVAIFTKTGPLLMAVTSNLNIDFLRPCIGDKVFVKAQIIKIGRTLAVINVDIHTDKTEKLASRSTVTYALPAQN